MEENKTQQNEIIIFENNISKKAGVPFTVFYENGKSVKNSFIGIDIEKTDELFVDKKNNRTVFPIKFMGEKYFGAIDGTAKELKPISKLIQELAENYTNKTQEVLPGEFLKSLLIGQADYEEQNRFFSKNSLPNKPSGCLLIHIENGKCEEAKEFIENYIEKDDILISLENDYLALIKFVSETDSEYRSVAEFSGFLIQSVYEETGVKATIYIGGRVKDVKEIYTSYQQAKNTERICRIINANGNVHNYKEYVIYKMLEDTPKLKLREYLDTLLDYGDSRFFEDKEMTDTAEAFLENGLNASETSRKLYLHRNTLTYRLDKIEKETGLDIRNFSDAVTFRLITLIKKLLK